MTTLVTGATGNTGRHVVAELVSRGEHVRALTRDPAAAAELLPAEVEIVAGTHTEPEGLETALHGVDRLHITVTAGLAEVGPQLVKQAVAAGVRRLTVVWGGESAPSNKQWRTREWSGPGSSRRSSCPTPSPGSTPSAPRA